jgi:hypothetical protein
MLTSDFGRDRRHGQVVAGGIWWEPGPVGPADPAEQGDEHGPLLSVRFWALFEGVHVED